MRIERTAHIAIILSFVGVLIILAKDLLIPIVLAVFVWFIIREIRMSMEKIKFLQKRMPRWLGNLLSSLFLFSFFGLVISIVSTNISLLSQKLPIYEENVSHVIRLINDTFHIDLFDKFKTYSGNLEFSSVLKMALNSITSIFGNVFIILIYILFMLLEESGFGAKLKAIYPDKENHDNTLKILEKIDHSVGQYLLLKTLMSLTTGLFSFIVLKFIGVDASFFWAFLIFVLNYIPTIGSLIATLFPTAFALLQFGELGPAIWVLVVIGAIQMVVGNLLEPKVMGNSLNLSPLVVLLALAIWGAFWGITGMVLSVPITVIMLILFSEFPTTRNIAILLSEKGKLN
jgi:AI-2 transport protein TqsA